MIQRGIELDVVTYNSSIDTLGKEGMLIEAKDVFDGMIQKGIEPNVVMYTSLIDTLGKEVMLTEAKDVFDAMIQRGIKPDGKRIDEARSIYREMSRKEIILDVATHTTLIAREPFVSLPTKGLQPDVQTYAVMVKGLCKEGLPKEACEQLEQMDKNNCLPNEFTYNAIIQGLLQHNERSKAIEYLQTMLDKGFSADAIAATMFVYLLSANQLDKTIQEFFLEVCVKVF
ncbi:hypothetical protein CJ030_MR0G025664 [Morella rubra]|uniref:Pentacotripeptide-repeat region of PRORP domain-containing protein n=1 Tax=Morella rubra TaxID=262757 RepID=A0A6A1UJC7_9ROSI|nr:hypothetical protein CJ030_MR0G025664 [Morella rubra]